MSESKRAEFAYYAAGCVMVAAYFLRWFAIVMLPISEQFQRAKPANDLEREQALKAFTLKDESAKSD